VKKSDVVKLILKDRINLPPKISSATAFAPTNIALCKYWGKRNSELNLPVTSSLSISLGDRGATANFELAEQDSITLNNQSVELSSKFGKRLIEFLNLFRTSCHSREGGNPFGIDSHPASGISDLRSGNDTSYYKITIQSNIPIAAGMASSACGFASIILALDKLFAWELSPSELSILARLGSGSASRSIWQGFVEWHAGTREDGLDSHGESLSSNWPDLCIGLLIVSAKDKGLSSREAMQRTVLTSPLYSAWPEKVKHDLTSLKKAISTKDFELLGQTSESNAMNMHATMLSAWPPVTYFLPETVTAMQKIWQLRQEGLPVYFTQDAGPNLKLLVLRKDVDVLKENFPQIEVLFPWESKPAFTPQT
jgi:diphosphomevalonate decarboxylase